MITTSVTLNLRTAEGLAAAKQAVLDATTAVFHDAIVPAAKALSPVLDKKTSERWPGENRDSIGTKVYESTKGVKASLYTESGYGGYLEVGTKHMKAEPYLFPAYEQNISQLPERVKEELSK